MAMQIVTPGETRTRVQRQPNFPMAGTMKPYGLYPMMITPVLPGETLLEFEMKRRTLSMPVRHPLVGAWLETWLVYVKLTDKRMPHRHRQSAALHLKLKKGLARKHRGHHHRIQPIRLHRPGHREIRLPLDAGPCLTGCNDLHSHVFSL